MINQYDNEIINELWDRKDSHERSVHSTLSCTNTVLYNRNIVYFRDGTILCIGEWVQY